MNLAMYILINNDIKLGKGLIAGQVGHAVEIFHYRKKSPNDLIENYMKKPRKIILQCSQCKLEELEKEGFVTIRESDTVQLPKNTLTCVNAGIYDRDKLEVPEFIKGLKLYSK